MIPVMISVTRRTMSAFSTCAVPNERTIAVVTSGYSRSARVRAPKHRDDTGRGRLLARRVHVEIGAQVGLLFRHGLEQQPLLRREVPVDGAQGDVGRRGHVAHLHRIEAPVGGQPERGIENPPPPGRLAARQGPLGRRFGVGLGGHHGRNWNTF